MKRTVRKELFATPEAFAGKEITVGGWCRNLRTSNVFGFVELNEFCKGKDKVFGGLVLALYIL